MNQWLFMSDKLIEIGVEIIVPMVEHAGERGEGIGDIDSETLTEWIYRILISMISVPSANTQNPDGMRAMLNKTLGPLLRPQRFSCGSPAPPTIDVSLIYSV